MANYFSDPGDDDDDHPSDFPDTDFGNEDEPEVEDPVATFGEKMKMQEEARSARIKSIMERYDCSNEDAVRFIDLREEGHTTYEAAVMAGLRDPD